MNREYRRNPEEAFESRRRAALYAIGLPEGGSVRDIKRAFRTKAKEYHPDYGGSEAKFKHLRQSYDFIMEDVQKNGPDWYLSQQPVEDSVDASTSEESTVDQPKPERPKEESPFRRREDWQEAVNAARAERDRARSAANEQPQDQPRRERPKERFFQGNEFLKAAREQFEGKEEEMLPYEREVRKMPLFTEGTRVTTKNNGKLEDFWVVSRINWEDQTYELTSRYIDRQGNHPEIARPFRDLEDAQYLYQSEAVKYDRFYPGQEVVVPRSNGTFDFHGWTIMQGNVRSSEGLRGYIVVNEEKRLQKFIAKDLLERVQHGFRH